jgi:hypothetical protein
MLGTMTERKAVTLALSAVVLLTTAACGAVVALGGGGEIVVVVMILVLGLGVDQVSKLILSYGPPDRR